MGLLCRSQWGYISGCLLKSWPHQFILGGASGGFCSNLLLRTKSAYEIKLGSPGFILVGLGNLQGQRLHKLPQQPVAVLDSPVVNHDASAKLAPNH